MKTTPLTIAAILSVFAVLQCNSSDCLPVQVHTTLGQYYSTGQIENEMVFVTFSTIGQCEGAGISLTLIGSEPEEIEAQSEVVHVQENIECDDDETVCPVPRQYQMSVHRIPLKHLELYKLYSFKCYGNLSDKQNPTLSTYQFNLPSPNPQTEERLPTSLFFFGNFVNAHPIAWPTRDRLIQQTAQVNQGQNVLFYLGSLGDQDTPEIGVNADMFLESNEVIFLNSPMMYTYSGMDSFLDYKLIDHRFRMPDYQKYKNQFWSVNIEAAHIISLNIDFLINNEDKGEKLLEWLKEDLELADHKNNRQIRPWIVVLTYHPLECSLRSDTEKICLKYKTSPLINQVWQLFRYHNVDIVISAEHEMYERTQPVYDSKTMKFEFNDPEQKHTDMQNLQGTVYIMEGRAGSPNNGQQFNNVEFSLTQSPLPGFGKLTFIDKTSIMYEHFQSDIGVPTDSFKISKTDPEKHHYFDYESPKKFQRIDYVFFVSIGLVVLVALFSILKRLFNCFRTRKRDDLLQEDGVYMEED